jgi:IS30 family transposase
VLPHKNIHLGTYEFISVFENILTDRGSEFGDPVSLETGIQGLQRSSIYYCDPMHSGQKGAIEQAHTMLSYGFTERNFF